MASIRTSDHIKRRKRNASRKANIRTQLGQLQQQYGIRIGMASHKGWHRLDFGLFGDSDFHAMRTKYQYNSLDQVEAFLDGIQSTVNSSNLIEDKDDTNPEVIWNRLHE